MIHDELEREIHLKDYLRVISKRRWTILAVFLIVVVMVTIYSFKMKPIYRATTKVLIEKENPKVVSFEEVMTLDRAATDYYQTQYKMMQSRSLANKVIKKLNLKNNPDFSPQEKKGFSIRGLLSSAVKGILNLFKSEEQKYLESADLKESKEESMLVDRFLAGLRIDPIRNSRLVDMSYEGHHPVLITKITNAISEAYIEKNLEVKYFASSEAKQWLDKQIKDQKKKLEESQMALQRYKEKNKIVSIGGREDIVVQRLTELSSDATRVEAERIEKETLYTELKRYANQPEKIETLPVIINNPLIQDLKADYVKLQRELSDLSKRYKPKHPKMIRLKSEMRVLYSKLVQEIKKLASSIETEYRILLSKERTLKKAFEDQKGHALNLDEKAIRYGILKREVDTDKEIYNTLLSRFKETSLTRELTAGNIRIVDRAEVPRFPVKPKKKLNILLAMIVGLSMGTGLAFFFEYLDHTISSPDDIEDYLRIPYLGGIERFSETLPDGIEKELFTLYDPKSTLTEAMKSIRTNVTMMRDGGLQRTILITSIVPREGKSTISANLAIVLAQTKKSVLLIDTDIRKPRIHTIFDLQPSPGLSDILQNKTTEAVIQHSPVENLKIMTSGNVSDNPSELLGSKKMWLLMEVLKKKYDYVLIDSPSIMVVTDPVILAKNTDDILIVIKKGEIARDVVRRTIGQLALADQGNNNSVKEKALLYNRVNIDFSSKILGAVLNQIDYKRDSYYYHYNRYYKDYYSDKRA
jgi:polysaccharide biosynthesis transport protein